MRTLTLSVLASFGLGACTPEAAAPTSTATLRFAPADGPMAWDAAPFPSDLFRIDGRFALGALPNDASDSPLFASLRALVAGRGACTTCAVYAHVDGGLDPSSLPASAEPGDSAALDDAALLVDVDPASEGFGDAIPLTVQYDAGRIAMRPVRGHVLRRNTRYAAVYTSALRGADGLPLSPAPAFEALRDGDDPVVAPALDVLEQLGLPREQVVGIGPFTTGDPTRDILAVRAAIEAAEAPVITVDQVWSGAGIDALLGVPAEDRPGMDVPPATEGTRAVRHDTTAVVVAGRFSAARFVRGSGTDTGPVTRDSDGLPTPHGTDEVPFLLLVPADADLADLPVVVAHHGFNASRTTGFAIADTVGRAGMAVLAIDGFQHGARARSASDDRNQMRDLDGPDGFSEAVSLDVSGRMFGMLGSEPGMAFAPELPLSAFEQLAADALSAIRLARSSDLAPLREAHPTLADLAFDGDRIAFVGNSMGAVVGTSVVTASPDVGAAVLDVLPGSIIDTLAESGEFHPITQGALLPAVGVDTTFDEDRLRMTLDPTVDLYRWAMEPVDPLALARYLHTERVAGDAPSLLVQLAGHDEVAAPGPSESVVAAAGIPGIGDFALAHVEPATLPSSVVAWRFDGAMHGMMEVEVQRSTWAEPLVPPLVPLADEEYVTNPIREVHAQIEAFLTGFVEDGVGTIE